jgi:hypothetical protein
MRTEASLDQSSLRRLLSHSVKGAERSLPGGQEGEGSAGREKSLLRSRELHESLICW